jgi:ABC-type taurine transport system ATPase subunit
LPSIGKVKPQTCCALCAAQRAEVLVEAGQQVGLGDQHVHRKVDAQVVAQLQQPLAQRHGVARALRIVGQRQVGDADGEDGAIDRLARAKLLQQLDEALPLALVGLAVALVRGVAARRCRSAPPRW